MDGNNTIQAPSMNKIIRLFNMLVCMDNSPDVNHVMMLGTKKKHNILLWPERILNAV